ncbi:MAG: AI-2E family transporter [Flavobacteriales bacterium]
MNQSIKNTITIISAIIFFVLVYFLNTLVAYIIISLVLALIGRPIMKVLKKINIKGKILPKSIRSLITLLALVFIFSSFFRLFAPLVIQEAQILSSINYNEVSKGLNEPIMSVENWLHENYLLDKNKSLLNELTAVFNLNQASNILNSLIQFLSNSIISIFSILFITYFFLKERNIFESIIESITPDDQIEKMRSALNNTKSLLTRYFIGISLQIVIITFIVSLGLTLIGIENAFLIGFLAGIINVIPYIGPIIGAAVGITIGISTNLDLDFYTQIIPLTLKITSVFVIMQLIDNFVFQPLIFSNSVKAHPLEIFIVIFSAGLLFGITAMLVAIPFYTIFRVMAKEFLHDFKFVQKLTRNI